MHAVLLIKTSSLGDVIHNLPVASDIRRACPDASIDWIVERAFRAIPALHTGIRNVIPCELRRWRKSWFTRATRAQWHAFVARVQAEEYDAVIDTQGLLKSAILARLVRGQRHGLDWQSSREPLRLFYDRTYRVSWNEHAVTRNRRLAAMALGYELQGGPDFGIRCIPSTAPWLPPKPYIVFLHATSQPRKLWPETNWVELGRRLSARGQSLLLPWGSADEHIRAKRLADAIPSARVTPALGFAELAAVITGAAAAVGVDTGLTHLAAALGIPVVGIYGATDPKATGVCAATAAASLGGPGCFPGVGEVIRALDGFATMVCDAGCRSP